MKQGSAAAANRRAGGADTVELVCSPFQSRCREQLATGSADSAFPLP
jgi:hypothetical protein